VQITVSDLPGERSSRDLDVVERARREVAGAGVVPDIAEVRAALALIGGSMAESVIAERGEY
jgi:hypothetical protein